MSEVEVAALIDLTKRVNKNKRCTPAKDHFRISSIRSRIDCHDPASYAQQIDASYDFATLTASRNMLFRAFHSAIFWRLLPSVPFLHVALGRRHLDAILLDAFLGGVQSWGVVLGSLRLAVNFGPQMLGAQIFTELINAFAHDVFSP
jgi:hypothetical protein